MKRGGNERDETQAKMKGEKKHMQTTAVRLATAVNAVHTQTCTAFKTHRHATE